MTQTQTTHDTLDKKTLAERGTILRCRTGSVAYGISTDSSDRDEIGICLEPKEYVTGLKTFEQWNHHSAGQNEDGTTRRSGAGDLDVTVYSARKFLRLYMNGNPSIIEVLHITGENVLVSHPLADELRENRHRLRGSDAGKRYMGYVQSQREKLDGTRANSVKRQELIDAHGYDTKFAAHALRLCWLGIDYVDSGEITLPMSRPDTDFLRGIRNGDMSFGRFMSVLSLWEDKLVETVQETEIPEPDYAWANDWLHRAHMTYWWGNL